MPAPSQLETKYLPIGSAHLEVKDQEGGPVRVAGYGSTFGGDPDSYGDIIAAGAYARTIRDWHARSWALPMLYNHDPSRVIGKWSLLAEDAVGLRMDGELTPGHSLARDVEASLRHGAISGLSIGFRTHKASTDDQQGIRTLEEIELFEVSVVTSPANERARVTGLKSADDIETIRDFEAMLREHGYSHRHAKLIAGKGYRAFQHLRDEGPDGGDEPDTTGKAPVEPQLEPTNNVRPADGKAVVNLLAQWRELITLPNP